MCAFMLCNLVSFNDLLQVLLFFRGESDVVLDRNDENKSVSCLKSRISALSHVKLIESMY